jgi:hypothetical protein
LAQDKEIHRVVTTLDKSNKSVVLFDSKVPLKIGGAGERVASLWVTEKGPADFSWDADRSEASKSFAPSNGGTYLLIVDFPPVGPEVDKLDVNTMMNVVGADAPKRGVPPSNPLMHRRLRAKTEGAQVTRQIYSEASSVPCGCHADLCILHDAFSNVLFIKMVGRFLAGPKRFELLTPRYSWPDAPSV